jgi:hypothetical protein
MRRSLEDRRLAVVSALRAVEAEYVVEDVVDAVDSRLDDLSSRLDEVLNRLGSVETMLLESAWERPAPLEPESTDDEDAATVVTVPAVDLGHGRMSSVAAKALFGH